MARRQQVIVQICRNNGPTTNLLTEVVQLTLKRTGILPQLGHFPKPAGSMIEGFSSAILAQVAAAPEKQTADVYLQIMLLYVRLTIFDKGTVSKNQNYANVVIGASIGKAAPLDFHFSIDPNSGESEEEALKNFKSLMDEMKEEVRKLTRPVIPNPHAIRLRSRVAETVSSTLLAIAHGRGPRSDSGQLH